MHLLQIISVMMGLLGLFGKKDLTYRTFEKWVSASLSTDLPEGIEAYCFNLYDDGKGQWSAEIIGAVSFDPENSDWACDEVFDNRQRPLKWSSRQSWEKILVQARSWPGLCRWRFDPFIAISSTQGILEDGQGPMLFSRQHRKNLEPSGGPQEG